LFLSVDDETVGDALSEDTGRGDFLIFSSAQPYVFANGGVGTVRFVRNVVL
jgi:hypothetical protein